MVLETGFRPAQTYFPFFPQAAKGRNGLFSFQIFPRRKFRDSIWGNAFCFVKKNFSLKSGADPGFGQGGARASEAESCRRSEVESHKQSKHSVTRVQGPLKGPGSFWGFDAQICILTHSKCRAIKQSMQGIVKVNTWVFILR